MLLSIILIILPVHILPNFFVFVQPLGPLPVNFMARVNNLYHMHVAALNENYACILSSCPIHLLFLLFNSRMPVTCKFLLWKVNPLVRVGKIRILPPITVYIRSGSTFCISISTSDILLTDTNSSNIDQGGGQNR